MGNFWKMIFNPHDGTRREALAEVTASRVKLESSASRLEETIAELLDRNDKLTGRPHVQPRT